jgi:indole-3-glycerol phosphate synthase
VVAALSRPPGAPLRLIAEVKLRSPSAGPLSRALTPGARARAYAEAGATMVSVLCDTLFFDGSFAHLAEARREVNVPLLAKEFVLDEVQLDLARAHGADAALLIARIVSRSDLARLTTAARARKLEPLVEVVDEAELDAALAAGARIVGVNARDLDTLAMDAARAARVLAAIPTGVVAVHLSGLKDPPSVRVVACSRADAALVGEALMRADDPRPLLAEMVKSGDGL